MKIKCINQKNFKNLTLNKVYDVIEDLEEGFYLIENDVASNMRYSKDYFENVIPEEIKPQPQPKPVVKEDIITISSNSGTITVIYNGSGVQLSIGSVSGNCGVSSIYNINGLARLLENDMAKFKKAIQAIIDCYQGKLGMLIFSTNDHPNIWNAMDEICGTSSNPCINPNSGAKIKTWIAYTNEKL